MFESLGVRGAAAGMGAGVAASTNHGHLITRTYESAVQAQQTAIAETKAIQQYVKLGSAYEAKKQWNSAEKSFDYALKVIALRDGVGSEKALPVLKHLVTVTCADHDFGQAVSYQKTVLQFAQAQAAKIPNPVAVINEQMTLANLYALKQDYVSAEPILQACLATATSSDAVPAAKRVIVSTTYARILRKLHKDAQADAVEAMQAGSDLAPEAAKMVSVKPEVTVPVEPSVPVASDHTPSRTVSDGTTTDHAPGSPGSPASPASPASTASNPESPQQSAP